MKTNCKFLIFITLASILIMPERIYAQTNNSFELGSTTALNSNNERLLHITIAGDGGMTPASFIRRYNESSGAYDFPHFNYVPFNMKIENTYSGETSIYTSSYWDIPGAQSDTRLTGVDMGSSIGGNIEYVIKKYTGEYFYSDYTGEGLSDFYTFTVDWKIEYNRDNPDRIIQTVTVNTGSIPAAADIKITLVHGYVPAIMGGAVSAITAPNIMRNGNYLNGSGLDVDYLLTKDEVRSLALTGIIDIIGTNGILAYYPIGQRFDVANSTFYASFDPGETFLYDNMNDVINYFDFLDDYWDAQHVVVGYYIPHGTTMTVQTGMIFTSELPVELDYTWRDNIADTTAKHLTVPMYTPASLRMAVNNLNQQVINNIGFRVNMPSTPTTTPIALPITGGTPAVPTGFNPTPTPSGDATFYQIANATMPSAPSVQPYFSTATALVPVSTAMYGEWTIDHTMIPDGYLSNIMPVTGQLPAILTVTTEVNYLSTDPATVAAGGSKTFTVKLPPGLTAHRDIVVNLTYTGTPSAFSVKPATMTIYEGDNSGTFTVTAASTAQTGDAVTITLTGTDYGAVIIGANNVVILSVEPQIHYIPVNPHLMSKIIVQ
jgi:hypothetical protein